MFLLYHTVITILDISFLHNIFLVLCGLFLLSQSLTIITAEWEASSYRKHFLPWGSTFVLFWGLFFVVVVFFWSLLISLLTISYLYNEHIMIVLKLKELFFYYVLNIFFCSICSVFLQEHQSWVCGISFVSLTHLSSFSDHFCLYAFPFCFEVCQTVSLLIVLPYFFAASDIFFLNSCI